MDKKAYNLKRTFEQPIVFYEFTDNFRWNKGVRADWAGTFIVLEIILIFLFFKGLGPIISSIQGLTLIYFTALPYFLTKHLVKLKQDGKKLMFFLWDFILYIFTIQIKKTRFSYDEEVLYQNKSKIRFK